MNSFRSFNSNSAPESLKTRLENKDSSKKLLLDLSEDVLHTLVNFSVEVDLKNSVCVMDDSIVETLRWSKNSLDFLISKAQNIVSLQDFTNMVHNNPVQLNLLFDSFLTSCLSTSVNQPKHLILFVSSFLYEVESLCASVLSLGVLEKLSIVTTVSEKAHNAYHPHLKAMSFETFKASLETHIPVQEKEKCPSSPKKIEDDEWAWDEQNEVKEGEIVMNKCEISIMQLPLHYALLLQSEFMNDGVPSTFVLTNPICTSAFPLMRSHLKDNSNLHEITDIDDVQADAIPNNSRLSFKFLAHTLGDTIMTMRLEVKDNIFAVGGTSFKVGHTLQHLLVEMKGDYTTHELKEFQTASVILVDRTFDLASPCSHSISLLDRILALLPQSPKSMQQHNRKTSPKFSSEVFLGMDDHVSPLITQDMHHFCDSTLCYQNMFRNTADNDDHNSKKTLFNAVALRPGKLALRILDKTCRSILSKLVKANMCERQSLLINRSKSQKGRDIVSHWMDIISSCLIKHHVEIENAVVSESMSAISIGKCMLEALERDNQFHTDIVQRNLNQYEKKNTEWMLPDLTEYIQYSLLEGNELLSIPKIMQLSIQTFSLINSNELYGDDLFASCLSRFKEALVDAILKQPIDELNEVAVLSGEVKQLIISLSLKISDPSTDITDKVSDEDLEDDWAWGDEKEETVENDTTTNYNKEELLQVRRSIHNELNHVITTLKECGLTRSKLKSLQDYVLVGNQEIRHTQSLLAQIVQCTLANEPIQELQHIVDASEQLTRAGIGLLKSGFSHLGFGSDKYSSETGHVNPHPKNCSIILLFVIGGITFQEVQDLNDVLGDRTDVQVIVGSTTITNDSIILEHIFPIQ